MEIVENEDDLRSYMRTAVKAKSRPPSPQLIAISLDVSVKWMPSLMVRDVLIPGIMEHIERAGGSTRGLNGGLPTTNF